MIEIIPAILVKSFSELQEKLGRYVGISKLVQIDICDGRFVPSITWPMQPNDSYSVENIIGEEEGMPYWDKLDFEFDLMILNAHKKFDLFMKLGAKRIIFHLEAEDEQGLMEFFESLDPYLKDNIEIGIAINNTTDINKLNKFINHIDFIQLMGIDHIGFQGEPFSEKVLKQIEELKQKYPEIKISIDGGVNEESAPILIDAGIDALVMGSTLLRSYDVKDTIEQFSNLN